MDEMSLDQLQNWRANIVKELASSQDTLAKIQIRIQELQEKLGLVDKLIVIEGGKEIGVTLLNVEIDLISICEEIIRERGEPIHIKDLHGVLLEKGIPLPGRGTDANLIVRLKRSNGKIIRTGRGMYGLPEFGLPEVRPTRKRRKSTR